MLQSLNTYNKIPLALSPVLNTVMTLEQYNACGWVHSLFWHHSDLHQLGTWLRLLTNRFVKIIFTASLPQQPPAYPWMSVSLVTIQNYCFTFSFKGILYFLGVSAICFPGLAWSEDGDVRFWWHQDDNASDGQQYVIRENSSAVISSRSLTSSSNIYLIYFFLEL